MLWQSWVGHGSSASGQRVSHWEDMVCLVVMVVRRLRQYAEAQESLPDLGGHPVTVRQIQNERYD